MSHLWAVNLIHYLHYLNPNEGFFTYRKNIFTYSQKYWGVS